jgi:serine-type D-Ala-D-Ala carboxypeptidase (penicillin-binding protein 5/6)
MAGIAQPANQTMRHPYLTKPLALCLILFLGQALADSPPAFQLKANSYILVDFASGNVLAEFQADKRMEPASLTKIMTAYVVFHKLKEGRLQMADKIAISDRAYRMGGSRMFVEQNSQVGVEDLLRGMIIQSGNDASVALAEQVAGSEESFAQLMNEQAKRLGMNGSHFTNATGMPDADHYTTARDMSMVTAALIREFPDYYRFYSERSFLYNKIKQFNRNKLLWEDDSVDGVKTGHTEAAGYCLVSSAKRGDTRMISVLLGAEKPNIRVVESKKLLDFGFNNFETQKLYGANQAVSKNRAWLGNKSELEIGFLEDLYLSLPRGSFSRLKSQPKIEEPLRAPIAKGQTVGELQLELDGKPWKTMPLVALQEIGEGGFFSRLIDRIRLWFH